MKTDKPYTEESILAPPFGLAGVTAIRHGQSTANVAFATAASTGSTELPVDGIDAEVPLSGRGIAQAAALGPWLAALSRDRRPDLVVCSTYLRARQTWETMAAAAAAHDYTPPPMLIDERLRDREMGVFELHTPAAISHRAPEEAERRARLGDWAYRPPGGESLADVALRVRDILLQLDRTVPGKRVLLVGHDGVIVALRYVIAGIGTPVPDGVTPVANASISHWEGDGHRLHLVTWGTTDHLTHEESAA